MNCRAPDGRLGLAWGRDSGRSREDEPKVGPFRHYDVHHFSELVKTANTGPIIQEPGVEWNILYPILNQVHQKHEDQAKQKGS